MSANVKRERLKGISIEDSSLSSRSSLLFPLIIFLSFLYFQLSKRIKKQIFHIRKRWNRFVGCRVLVCYRITVGPITIS
jgi:hypothetical protein